MYGLILGDITQYGKITRTTVMATAVAEALLAHHRFGGSFDSVLKEKLQSYQDSIDEGRNFELAACLYPVGLYSKNWTEMDSYANVAANVLMEDCEAKNAGRAVTMAAFLAKNRNGSAIWAYANSLFFGSCEKENSVAKSIRAFAETGTIENAIQAAKNIGGDAAVAGAIAWSHYRAQNGGYFTDDMIAWGYKMKSYLPQKFINVLLDFDAEIDPFRMVREYEGSWLSGYWVGEELVKDDSFKHHEYE